jgi:SAM-dependent methyltransferase
MDDTEGKLYKRNFWATENLKYAKPHFRLEKSARIINRLARNRECSLLDVGCGPATLMDLVSENIHYYGIDIAIHAPAPNLQQVDLIEEPIAFCSQKFDIVIAQGFFEYIAGYQDQKISEISDILKQNGKFIATYVNFGHRDRQIYQPYSNIQSIRNLRASLARRFYVDRCFPTSYNWCHSEPNRRLLRESQLRLNLNVPVIGPSLAVEYFFICSRFEDRQRHRQSRLPTLKTRGLRFTTV